jgi:hypothetical protein
MRPIPQWRELYPARVRPGPRPIWRMASATSEHRPQPIFAARAGGLQAIGGACRPCFARHLRLSSTPGRQAAGPEANLSRAEDPSRLAGRRVDSGATTTLLQTIRTRHARGRAAEAAKCSIKASPRLLWDAVNLQPRR